jgi:hypothetical protein
MGRKKENGKKKYRKGGRKVGRKVVWKRELRGREEIRGKGRNEGMKLKEIR